jgi:hypothetical protein
MLGELIDRGGEYVQQKIVSTIQRLIASGVCYRA